MHNIKIYAKNHQLQSVSKEIIIKVSANLNGNIFILQKVVNYHKTINLVIQVHID
jgi:hypothetical protein